MTDQQTVDALRAAMAAQTRDRRLAPDTVRAALAAYENPRSQRHIGRFLAVAAACLAVLTAAVIVAVTRPSAHRATPPTAAGCAGSVVTGPLPTWARNGFSASVPVMPYVTGAEGEIVGILFAHPLLAPPRPGTNDKILWVARDPAGPFVITSTRLGSAEKVVTRVESGPGPSAVNLTTPGCWRFDLRWPGHDDVVYLPYSAP